MYLPCACVYTHIFAALVSSNGCLMLVAAAHRVLPEDRDHITPRAWRIHQVGRPSVRSCIHSFPISCITHISSALFSLTHTFCIYTRTLTVTCTVLFCTYIMPIAPCVVSVDKSDTEHPMYFGVADPMRSPAGQKVGRHIYIHIYTVHTYTYIYIYTHTYVLYIYTYIYIYILIYLHTVHTMRTLLNPYYH